MTVAALLAAQSQVPVVPVDLSSPERIGEMVRVEYSNCLVRNEEGGTSSFELVSDPRWSYYRYKESDGLRTESGAFLTIKGNNRFAGWQYEHEDKYSIPGHAFRNSSGEMLIFEYGVYSPPGVEVLYSNRDQKFSKSDILKKAITAAVIGADGKSMTLYAGVCTLKKTEIMPPQKGVRDIAR